MVSFPEAIRVVLSKYATFSGRARRSEYWWFTLFVVLVSFAAGVVDGVLTTSIFQIIVLLALLLPSIAVAVRRLHDTGRSGWWYLIAFVPLVGLIVLLVFLVQDTQPGANRFGPPPKYAAEGYGSAPAQP